MDFWAGYLSGAAGILIGNPLDILKTRLQAGPPQPITRAAAHGPRSGSIPLSHSPFLGAASPILGYGLLNAILFSSYNRTLAVLHPALGQNAGQPGGWELWTAGAVGGLATFVISAPTELIKCRAQVQSVGMGQLENSLHIAQGIWRRSGVRGLYLGGTVTAVRDAVGYGF
jgi:solute carrier family 25 (mitochondrial carnitine/acylcarnitine transporter), member 20/29